MKIMTVFFLLLISSAAVILAQTAHIQPVQAKSQCETNEDGVRVCTGGQGGCGPSSVDRTRCGGEGGRSEQSGGTHSELTQQGGGGGRTEFDSGGPSIQGGEGGRRVCTVDPDTNTQVCEGVGSRYN